MPITDTEEETQDIAKEIAGKFESGGIICLYGDLGSGKTTFTKGIAEYHGIDKFALKSPTYTYIRKYETAKNTPIYHIDLYRINEIDELLLEEINELTNNPQNLIIIEWADKIKEHLPTNRQDIHLEYIDKSRRKITID